MRTFDFSLRLLLFLSSLSCAAPPENVDRLRKAEDVCLTFTIDADNFDRNWVEEMALNGVTYLSPPRDIRLMLREKLLGYARDLRNGSRGDDIEGPNRSRTLFFIRNDDDGNGVWRVHPPQLEMPTPSLLEVEPWKPPHVRSEEWSHFLKQLEVYQRWKLCVAQTLRDRGAIRSHPKEGPWVLQRFLLRHRIGPYGAIAHRDGDYLPHSRIAFVFAAPGESTTTFRPIHSKDFLWEDLRLSPTEVKKMRLHTEEALKQRRTLQPDAAFFSSEAISTLNGALTEDHAWFRAPRNKVVVIAPDVVHAPPRIGDKEERASLTTFIGPPGSLCSLQDTALL